MIRFRSSNLILLILNLIVTFVTSQDGSSELFIEKPTHATLNSRLRVRCTDDNLRLYSNATACADEREPESCKMIFGVSWSNSPASRDPKCDNPLLKDLADQCRHTCAICCEDETYSCQNDDSKYSLFFKSFSKVTLFLLFYSTSFRRYCKL